MATLRIAACQLNLNVGDLSGNKEKILSAYANAQDKGSDIAVFTELAVSGYPPEDLLLKRGFVHDTQKMVKEIASHTSDCVAVLGYINGQAAAADPVKRTSNAAAICFNDERSWALTVNEPFQIMEFLMRRDISHLEMNRYKSIKYEESISE